mgnify:FL=1|tara:strand:- start:1507 stop:2223 length:717 start_codon:yes stop_codon:yes gene_type:complete
MTKNFYLILFLFTSVLLLGFYFTSEIKDFLMAHLGHLGIMLVSGLLLVAPNKGKLPKKQSSSFMIDQIFGVITGTFGLLCLGNFIPVLASKLAGIEMSRFTKSAEFNRILIIVISISIFEEILFRRILAQKINNSLGFKKAIWISALIFGLVHIYSDTGIINASIAGGIFAYIYLKTNNIYLSISAHLSYNLTTYFITPVFMKNFDAINKYSIIVAVIITGLILIFGMTRILNKKANG